LPFWSAQIVTRDPCVRANAAPISAPSHRADELMNPWLSDGYSELDLVTVEVDCAGGGAVAEGGTGLTVNDFLTTSLTNPTVATSAATPARSASVEAVRDRQLVTE
jgi:hypothetical protein